MTRERVALFGAGLCASGLEQGKNPVEQFGHTAVTALKALKLFEDGNRSFAVKPAWVLGSQEYHRTANPLHVLGLE